MQQILVYGDSLSWGIIPGTRERFDFDRRWPGVMEKQLASSGRSVRVMEDCLSGRRTVWDDPFKAGRNGLVGIEQRIEVHSPLSLIIVLLGTNDFQAVHQYNAWQSAQGIATLIAAIRRAPIEPGMSIPPILIVAPPPPLTAKGDLAPKFAGAEDKAVGLNEELRRVAAELECSFFDAGTVSAISPVDGVHLDEDQQLVLGRAIAEKVTTLLPQA